MAGRPNIHRTQMVIPALGPPRRPDPGYLVTEDGEYIRIESQDTTGQTGGLLI